MPLSGCFNERMASQRDAVEMDEARRPRQLRVTSLLVLLLATGYAIGIWWLDRWSIGVAFEAYLSWQRVLANAAPGLTVFMLLAALTRRLLMPILLVSALHALVYLVSSIKYRLLDIVLVLQDVHFISGLDASSIALLWHYVPSPWRAAGLLLAGVLVLALACRIEPPWCRARGWPRLVAAGSAMALLCALHFSLWPWTSRMYDKAHVRPSLFGLNRAALRAGLTTSMIHYHNQQRQLAFAVDTVALQKAMAMLPPVQAAPVVQGAAGARPDIVIVLSESFMDPRVMRGMAHVPDLIPEVRAQLAAGHGGRLQVPAFGGGTVRTEFEVLTGMPMHAFPEVRYPYVDMRLDHIPGIVDVLEKAGYASVALHGNSGGVWNRLGTYKAMGMDRFITKPDFLQRGAARDGKWLSDRSMTDILLQELDRSDKPTLAVAISMENHGPYDDAGQVTAPDAMAAITLPAGLDEKSAGELRSYLYHLRNADREFARLLTGLRARPRPFVLLFFGDHLPALGDVYDRLGFVDGRLPADQTVPWVIATSWNATAPGHGTVTYAWQLPSMILRTAGVQADAYFDVVARFGPELAADPLSSRGVLLEAGLHAAANARLRNRFEDYVRK